MLPSQQKILAQAIYNSLNQLNFLINIDDIQLENTKHSKHGDVSCNIAMKIAGNKNLPKQNPRDVAQNIINALKMQLSLQNIVSKYEIAGAGFINIFLTQQAKIQVIVDVLKEKNNFGHTSIHNNQYIMLEFVSANPTGPLHVGHGRQAALGDCLGRLLKTQGYNVYNEFYYNDAGVQIQNLALSVQMRAKGYTPEHLDWPENAYNGSYIEDIAQSFKNKTTVENSLFGFVKASGDIENIEDIRHFAVAYLRNEQDIDLKMFDVSFDNYYLESSLYKDGKVKDVVQSLIDNEKTYTHVDVNKGEALYLKTTDYGDDKDRVMRKSNGEYTYFVPDIAYHVTKFKRGFAKVINIQGFDHHGTIARVRAGLQSLNIGIPKQYPDYILHKMVTVFKHGKEVKISKRAGSYVTLRDLIEWSGEVQPQSDVETNSGKTSNFSVQKGRDAVRFFLITRKADTEFIFNVDLAIQQTDENPVYYIQYAHARIASVLHNFYKNINTNVNLDVDMDIIFNDDMIKNLCLLDSEHELALLSKLAYYPFLLQQSSADMSPHNIAFYLKDLAALFHSFYANHKVLIDNVNLRDARLYLLLATKQIIANGLGLMGVSAPSRM